MADTLGAPPVLSTPETHIFTESSVGDSTMHRERLSDEQLQTRYEISRTIQEIRDQKWHRVALQFPDEMLPYSARVYQSLARGLRPSAKRNGIDKEQNEHGMNEPSVLDYDVSGLSSGYEEPVKLTILADTSYGSCCVDEIAAEHVDADAVVHYGRSCLSPTARLPVLHVFTKMELDYTKAIQAFKDEFSDHGSKVIVTADVPYFEHVGKLCTQLISIGYGNVFASAIIHDPASPIPNRTIPPSVRSEQSSLKEWHLFHISEPPTSLLLTLISAMASVRVFPASESSSFSSNNPDRSSALLLRRRYALVTSLATVSVWGILINTLSVKNYLHMVEHVKKAISDAGKKSYLFVVGKINPAKVANFSEIGGWVVVGCWESSLIDSKDFYRPIITPFELDLVLQGDEGRVWTGAWRGDFESVFEAAKKRGEAAQSVEQAGEKGKHERELASENEEDEPPEFDLRTGKLVGRTRPMGRRHAASAAITNASQPSAALSKRVHGDMVAVNGVASPAAQFLTERRTWKGLGSDYEIKYEDEEEEGGLVEEGRTGVAGGYTVGESERT